MLATTAEDAPLEPASADASAASAPAPAAAARRTSGARRGNKRMSLKSLKDVKAGKQDARSAAVKRWSMSMDAIHSLEQKAGAAAAFAERFDPPTIGGDLQLDLPGGGAATAAVTTAAAVAAAAPRGQISPERMIRTSDAVALSAERRADRAVRFSANVHTFFSDDSCQEYDEEVDHEHRQLARTEMESWGTALDRKLKYSSSPPRPASMLSEPEPELEDSDDDRLDNHMDDLESLLYLQDFLEK